MRNRILFIALNGHQRRYFRALGDYLKSEYDIYHVDYSLTNSTSLFIDTDIPDKLTISNGEIEDIISFLLTKAQYRKFGILRRFLHSRPVLIRQTKAAIHYFYKFITQNNIDMVCVWNGTLPPLGAATCVAKKMGRKTMFFENGYLPNTTTVDPKGVNNNNSLIGKPQSFYNVVQVDSSRLQKLFVKPPAIRELKSRWYQRIVKKKPVGQPEQIEFPERYVFVPFQVHDDTQILLHSPNIKTMRELIECIIPAVEQYNALTGDNLWIIVKEHPSDFGRTDYRDLEEKYRGHKVHFLRYYSTPELIKRAQGIITINSSVGVESLLVHKPVITLGKAFYNVEGVVEHVSELEALADTIQYINKPVNTQLIDKFLYYLRYEYLVEGSWRQPDSVHFSDVKARIQQSIGIKE